MADQRYPVDIPLAQGLDTRTDPLLLPQGRLVSAKNVVFDRPGGLRPGPLLTDIGRGAYKSGAESTYQPQKIDHIYDVLSANGEILLAASASIPGGYGFTGGQMFARRAGTWEPVGSFLPVRSRISASATTDENIDSCSLAVIGEYALVVHGRSDSTQIWYASVMEWRTGRVVFSRFGVNPTSTRAVKAAVQGSSFVAYSSTGVKTTIPTDGGLGVFANSSPFSDVHTDYLFDVVSASRPGSPNNGCHYVAYKENVSGYIKVKRIDQSGTATHTATISAVPKNCVNIWMMFDGSEDQVGVAWQDNTDHDVDIEVFTADDLTGAGIATKYSLGATETLYGVTATADPAEDHLATTRAVAVFIDARALEVSDLHDVVKWVVIDAADGSTLSAGGTLGNSYALVSHAFTFDRQPLFVGCHGDDLDYVGHVVVAGSGSTYGTGLATGDGTSERAPKPVGRVLSLAGDTRPAYKGSMSRVIEVEPGRFLYAARRQDRLASDGAILRAAVLVDLEVGKPTKPGTGAAGTAYIPGGHVWQYDGCYLAEAGFHHPPAAITPSGSASGGSMSDGTYSYRVTWEWTDRNGDIHRSVPSAAASVTLNAGGSSQSVTAKIYAIRAVAAAKVGDETYAIGRIRYAVYRTAASGTIYYKSLEGTLDATADDVVAITDTQADSTLIDNEILYTDGGVLENDIAPQPAGLASVGDLVGVLSADDLARVYISKPKAQGDGLSFNGATYVDVPLRGPGTALAALDGAFVAMSEQSIAVFAGEGFGNTGQGPGFGRPRPISSSIGALAGTPTVVTAQGVYFQSHRGIYLLDRGQSLQYAGAPAEALVRGRKVTKAFVDTTSHRVVFILDDRKTILALDESQGQWSTFELDGVIAGESGADGAYFATPAKILREDANGNPPGPVEIETGIIQPAGPGGAVKIPEVLVVGSFRKGGQIEVTLKVVTDSHEDPKEETHKITLDRASSLIRVIPQHQRCSGMSVAVREVTRSVDALTALRLFVIPRTKKDLPEGLTI